MSDRSFVRPRERTAVLPGLAAGVSAALIVVGFVQMVRGLIAIPYLDDEIFSGEFLAPWFSHHLWAYLAQWQMYIYPPKSPIFGDGFVPPYLYGFSQRLFPDIDPIHAARLVSLGATVCCGYFVFRYLKRHVPPVYAWLGTGFFFALPTAIYGAATAYDEALLAAEFALVLLLIDCGRAPSSVLRSALAGIIIAIGLMTKLSTVLLWAAVVAFGMYGVIARKPRAWMHVLLLIVVPPLAVVTIWSGAREPAELAGIVHYLFGVRGSLGLQPPVPTGINLVSYGLMLFATMGTGAAIVSALLAATLPWTRALSPRTLALSAFILLYLAFLGLFVRGSTHHQIITLQPFVAVLVTLVFAQVMESKNSVADPRKTAVPYAATAIVGLALMCTVIRLPVATAGLYESSLGQALSLQRFFVSGDGELQRQAADWIRSHRSPPYGVCNLGQDYAMMRNAPFIGLVKPLFVQSVRGVLADGCRYAVVYSSYLRWAQSAPQGSVLRLLLDGPSAAILRGQAASLHIYDVRSDSRPLAYRPCRVDCTQWDRPTQMFVQNKHEEVGVRFIFPPVYARAGLSVAVVSVPPGADAVSVSFQVRAKGCSESAVDITGAGWGDGSYDRLFDRTSCSSGAGWTAVHHVIPTPSGVNRLYLRVATDSRFSRVQHIEIRRLRFSAVEVRLEGATEESKT